LVTRNRLAVALCVLSLYFFPNSLHLVKKPPCLGASRLTIDFMFFDRPGFLIGNG
jgi:hypothetical protein